MNTMISLYHRYAHRVLILLILSVSSQAFSTQGHKTYAITNLTVVDIYNGDKKVMDLLINGERIAGLSLAGVLALPKHTRVIDGRGLFALPGLWDAHAHIAIFPEDAKQRAKLYVANGVTSIRDTGGRLEDLLALRRHSDRPGIVAPRLRFAGPIIDGTPRISHGGPEKADISVEVNTPAEAIKMVDKLAKHGVDFIKPYQFLRPDVFKALVQRAQHYQLPLAGHIPSQMTIPEVLALAEYDIQHIAGNLVNVVFEGVKDGHPLPDRGKILAARTDESAEELVRQFHFEATVTPNEMDAEKMVALAQQFVRRGAWYTPTLSSATGFEVLGLQDDPFVTNSKQYRCRQKRRAMQQSDDLDQREQATWGKVVDQRRLLAEYNLHWVNQLHQAGVPILAGGESAAVVGFNIHLELQALVKAGLSPLEALQAATLNPARFFRITDELGSIAVGKLADILIVDKDPLEDIANTRRIHSVVSKGQLLDRQALDQVLQDVVEACRG